MKRETARWRVALRSCSAEGAKGAFQVGVLHELVVNRGISVDIIAGVSTGAIQALGAAQDDVPRLLQQWLDIKGSRDIYRERPLGIGGGVLGADAIYDAAPLRRLLKNFANDTKLKARGRKLLLGVVNLGTGGYRQLGRTRSRGRSRIADHGFGQRRREILRSVKHAERLRRTRKAAGTMTRIAWRGAVPRGQDTQPVDQVDWACVRSDAPKVELH